MGKESVASLGGGHRQAVYAAWPFLKSFMPPACQMQPVQFTISGLEQDASELSIYQGEVIPGLFQTEAYARALISTSVTVAPADEEKVVAARIRCQTLLVHENAPKVRVVLGEAALLRQVGGQKVIIDQSARLIELAKLPHITIQVTSASTT